MNHRLTKKDLGLIRGAIRRAFSRSTLRKEIIEASIVAYSDPGRPRVKSWCQCKICGHHIPKSYMVVDHIAPVIAVTERSEDITFDNFIDRLWCIKDNLQPICKECHEVKTKAENKLRRANKKR
jgi:5-methylcytosine-specific restriction endonuclease McrA